jgi:hypothetical protein
MDLTWIVFWRMVLSLDRGPWRAIHTDETIKRHLLN